MSKVSYLTKASNELPIWELDNIKISLSSTRTYAAVFVEL